ncbi:hypothetical protein DER45DRAFT_217209 [Fusarium avenaceum]|nr:hypothetical protein DER45DRAFT_217209 [Fusarium avenaceum]
MEFRLPDAWARQTIRSQSCSYGFLVANRIMIFTIGLPVLYAPGTRALSCCWRLDKKDNVLDIRPQLHRSHIQFSIARRVNCYPTYAGAICQLPYFLFARLCRGHATFDMSCARPKLPLVMETDQALPAHEPILTRREERLSSTISEVVFNTILTISPIEVYDIQLLASET